MVMSADLRPLPLDTTRTALRFAALVLLAVAAVMVYSAESASAHPRLVRLTPAAGAVLTAEPQTAVLIFNEDVVASATVVTVTDSTGAGVASGSASVEGRRVVLPLRRHLGGGTYTVTYRVVGGGQAASGRSTFSLLPTSTVRAHPSIS
jgi:methionine-rich copper-binding protein CopC